MELPPTAVRQWRSLIAVRQALVGRRVAVQNRIRALFVAQGLPAPRGAKAWTELGLAGIATHAKPLADCGPEELEAEKGRKAVIRHSLAMDRHKGIRNDPNPPLFVRP